MPPRRRARRRRNAPAIPAAFIRRRSTRWLIAASITLAVALILGAIGGRLGGGGSPTPTPAVATTATATGDAPTATPAVSGAISPPALHPDTSLLERAAVTHIVDGDTIDVRLGDRVERVRYYGIDTPERGEPCYKEAKDRNEALSGDTVLLLPDARDRDRGGRLLRYIFDERGDSIDATLIAEGLAHAWTEDGAYRDTLLALEGQAHAAAVGCLWTP